MHLCYTTKQKKKDVKYKIFCNAHYISHTGTRIPTTIRLSWWKSFFMSMLNSNFRWTTWFSWWQNSVTVSSYFFLITYSTPYTSIFHLQKIIHTPEYNNPVSRVPHQGVEHSLYFLCFILCLNKEALWNTYGWSPYEFLPH